MTDTRRAATELARHSQWHRTEHRPSFTLAALEALAAAPAPSDPNLIRQICICDVEDCYCLETAEIPIRIAAESYYECPACQDGRHVDVAGERR